jgi:hypothetical protein
MSLTRARTHRVPPFFAVRGFGTMTDAPFSAANSRPTNAPNKNPASRMVAGVGACGGPELFVRLKGQSKAVQEVVKFLGVPRQEREDVANVFYGVAVVLRGEDAAAGPEVAMGGAAHEIDRGVGDLRLAGLVRSHIGTFPARVRGTLRRLRVKWPVARSLGAIE